MNKLTEAASNTVDCGIWEIILLIVDSWSYVNQNLLLYKTVWFGNDTINLCIEINVTGIRCRIPLRHFAFQLAQHSARAYFPQNGTLSEINSTSVQPIWKHQRLPWEVMKIIYDLINFLAL